METIERQGQANAAIGGLSLDACVVLASSKLSADDVERARRAGSLRMGFPGDGAAYLEVGGTVVAEGRMKKRRGTSVFIVTRTYQDSGEVRS